MLAMSLKVTIKIRFIWFDWRGRPI